MSKLPPETLARIDSEAKEWAEADLGYAPDLARAYEAGAIREAELAMELVEALEVYAGGWPGPAGSHEQHLSKQIAEIQATVAREALARYRSGGMK